MPEDLINSLGSQIGSFIEKTIFLFGVLSISELISNVKKKSQIRK